MHSVIWNRFLLTDPTVLQCKTYPVHRIVGHCDIATEQDSPQPGGDRDDEGPRNEKEDPGHYFHMEDKAKRPNELATPATEANPPHQPSLAQPPRSQP